MEFDLLDLRGVIAVKLSIYLRMDNIVTVFVEDFVNDWAEPEQNPFPRPSPPFLPNPVFLGRSEHFPASHTNPKLVQ